MKQNRIVLNLDGVLCETINEKYLESFPIEENIGTINELYRKGYEIIIDSDRGWNKLGKEIGDLISLTTEQLNLWGVQYHKLRLGVRFKADFSIDDSNFTVEGLKYLNQEDGNGEIHKIN